MTNEEKALKISGLKERPDDEERYYNSFGCKIYDIALEIAEWKEQQMIEKAQDLLANWFYEHPHTQMVCSDEFKNVDDLLEKFKDAMEE